MKFLSGLFEGKDAQAIRHVMAGQAAGIDGMPYRLGWSTERAVKDGLERVGIVFKCVDTIATNAARLPVVVRAGGRTEEDKIIQNHPVAKKFATMVNEYEYGMHFIYRVAATMLLAKQGVYVEHLRSRIGKLAGLYLLPSDQTHPVPGDGKFVEEYLVEGLNGTIDHLPPEKVIWIRKPHPTDPYSSLTPMEAAGISIDTDFYARLFNRDFMLSDGRPAGMVAIKGGMRDGDIDEIRRRFRGRSGATTPAAGQAGEVTVIEAETLEWIDMHTSQRDAQYVESMKLNKDDIMLAFGVPESVMGNASGRTFDNADAEKEIFWEATMVPLLELIFNALDIVTGSISDDEYLCPDYSSVDVLQRTRRLREDRLTSQHEKGLISTDEWREGTGRSPFGRPRSRVLLVPASGKMPIGAEGDEKTVDEAVVLGSPAPEEEEEGEGGGMLPAAASNGVGAPARSTRRLVKDPAKAEAKHLAVGPGGAHPNGTPQTVHGRAGLSTLQSRALAGGFTYRAIGNTFPDKGFALSTVTDRERRFTVAEFAKSGKEMIRSFREDNADVLGEKNHFLGAWVEDGMVYLDVSTVLFDREEAVRLAHEHEQIAIWDLENSVPIEITPAAELERLT